MSNPRDLWPLRHLIRVMRRHDPTKKKTMTKTNTKTKTITKTNTFREHLQRAILETFDLWGIWSECWENLTWPTKGQLERQRQRQWQIHLENTFKERSLKLFTSESESEWQKGPNLPAHMSPYLFHPCSTLFHPFGASRAAYGHKAHFWPFSAPPEPTDGNFWT